MKFFIYQGTTGFIFLALALLSVDMAVGLAGKTHEQAMQEICSGRTDGESENVDKACKALGCNGNYPC